MKLKLITGLLLLLGQNVYASQALYLQSATERPGTFILNVVLQDQNADGTYQIDLIDNHNETTSLTAEVQAVRGTQFDVFGQWTDVKAQNSDYTVVLHIGNITAAHKTIIYGELNYNDGGQVKISDKRPTSLPGSHGRP